MNEILPYLKFKRFDNTFGVTLLAETKN